MASFLGLKITHILYTIFGVGIFVGVPFAVVSHSSAPLDTAIISESPLPPTPELRNQRDRIVYASIEKGVLKLNSVGIDGKDAKTILETEVGTDAVRSRLGDFLNGTVSSTGKYLAYRIFSKENKYVYAPAALNLLDLSTAKSVSVGDKVGTYHWSPDGNILLYGTVTEPPRKEYEELSMQPSNGYEWHTYDVSTGKDTVVAKPTDKLYGVDFWKSPTEIVMMRNDVLSSEEHFVLDLQSGKIREATEYGKFYESTSIPRLSDTALYFLRMQHGVNSCEVEIQSTTGEIESKNTMTDFSMCRPTAWLGTEASYYTKTTRRDGSTPAEPKPGDGYGRYAYDSVYRYNAKTEQSEKVLSELDQGQSYTLLDIVDGKKLLVLHQADNSGGKLEIRDLDGTNPVELYSNETEVSFLGLAE